MRSKDHLICVVAHAWRLLLFQLMATQRRRVMYKDTLSLAGGLFLTSCVLRTRSSLKRHTRCQVGSDLLLRHITDRFGPSKTTSTVIVSLCDCSWMASVSMRRCRYSCRCASFNLQVDTLEVLFEVLLLLQLLVKHLLLARQFHRLLHLSYVLLAILRKLFVLGWAKFDTTWGIEEFSRCRKLLIHFRGEFLRCGPHIKTSSLLFLIKYVGNIVAVTLCLIRGSRVDGNDLIANCLCLIIII